jgi:photosystem II stability/assembly factor-like uncharacterized protein
MVVEGWVTNDDGETWTPLGDWPVEDLETSHLRVSPADPGVLYLAVESVPGSREGVRFLHSLDAGNTWQRTSTVHPAEGVKMSVLSTTLFETHPSDPGVVFQTVVEFNAGDHDGAVRRSADHGQTLSDVLFRSGRRPEHLVGGWGAGGHRFFCPLGAELYRSDDDGVTWEMVASFAAEHLGIEDLDVDPTDPNQDYVVLTDGQVRSSQDDGLTWADLGTPYDSANDLALGVDQKNLYLATNHGVLRLALR